MKNQEQKPFLKRLEDGIETKMLLLGHNSTWTDLLICENKYENLELEVFAEGTDYINLRLSKKGYILPDCDFIIFYSSSFYNPNELLYLEQLANQYSKDANKRVTVGYSYVIPKHQRKNDNITDEIKLYSIKDGEEEKITISAPESLYFTTLSLTDIVTKYHDSFEKQEEKSPKEQSPNSLKKVLPVKND